MEATQYRTPYEKYLVEGIAEEKKNLDSLYTQFARTSSLKKQLLKRKIDETIQNIDLLSKELEKYKQGLSWLREPSKERDEKAEHLEKVQEEPQAAPAGSQAKSGMGAPRTTVGTPVGSLRPSVGTPVGSKPIVGTPVGRPTVGTPVGKPRVGTPEQTSSTPSPKNSQPNEDAATPPPAQTSSRPRVGKPLKDEKS